MGTLIDVFKRMCVTYFLSRNLICGVCNKLNVFPVNQDEDPLFLAFGLRLKSVAYSYLSIFLENKQTKNN